MLHDKLIRDDRRLFAPAVKSIQDFWAMPSEFLTFATAAGSLWKDR